MAELCAYEIPINRPYLTLIVNIHTQCTKRSEDTVLLAVCHMSVCTVCRVLQRYAGFYVAYNGQHWKYCPNVGAIYLTLAKFRQYTYIPNIAPTLFATRIVFHSETLLR